ncbi:MAG: 2-dehydropantoate 2-reductase [Elusimicrobia bacterium]|nr:2-dehydropantoate 2-reductase [Elusimicrobiota bacterium]
MKHILIVGPGAIGGLMAACFANSGFKVDILGKNPRHIAQIRQRGFMINGSTVSSRKFHGIETQVSRLSSPELVFFCTKSYDTTRAVRNAFPLARKAKAVVSLQNGLCHIPILSRAFGRKKMILGVCYIAATRLSPTHIRHVIGHSIQLASHAQNKRLVGEIGAVLTRSGWKVHILPDERRMLWTKLLLNASANPIAALSQYPNDQVAKNPVLRDLLVKTMDEILGIMRRAGIHPVSRLHKKAIVEGMEKSTGQINSMLQDIQAGRPTEADAILLPVLRLAKKQGQKTPLLENLYRFVKGLEK